MIFEKLSSKSSKSWWIFHRPTYFFNPEITIIPMICSHWHRTFTNTFFSNPGTSIVSSDVRNKQGGGFQQDPSKCLLLHY
jgi:hypothetical protein